MAEVDGVTTARLCAVGDLSPGEARRFDVAGLRVALVRIGDEFHAVGDRCCLLYTSPSPRD